ncbi:MAG TPA: cupin domain-containing protein [Candidatus Limnocylindrales bacterium]|nr:cupin domain-containing protein [Candidatus Limnocylindrales bacterium]
MDGETSGPGVDVPALRGVAGLDVLDIWEGVVARRVEGERITLSVVELAPDSIVPEHRHPNEQLGIVLRGGLRFRVGDEERELSPGDTWTIPGGVPHEVHTGPDGAVLIDVFSPPRRDWDAAPRSGPRPPVWPADGEPA